MPSPTVTADAVESVVFEALKGFGVEEDLLSREAEVVALDIDSLDLAELAQVLDDELGVEIKGDDVKGITTVGDLIDRVVAKAA
ncbi:phosphopantetheine-binding protein [Paraconexibacter sp.]|uniref:phosphopantetheine-binding protein n=1 Tax=Paraconexibacter sp. TaxID=2949640 RepID=UPI0035673511